MAGGPRKGVGMIPRDRRILFLATHFPVLSETFVWREAVSLGRLGHVDFMALTPLPGDTDAFPAPVRQLMRLVAYRRTSGAEIAGVALEVLRQPRAMLTAVHAWRAVYPWRRCLGRIYGLARLRHQTRRRAVDVIHAHWRGAGDIAHMHGRLFGTSFTLFLHAHDIYDEGLKEPDYRPLFTTKIEAAQAVFTCTERNRQVLSGLFPSARIELCYHGVPTTLIEAAQGHSRRPMCPLRLLSVGRLVEYKGFDDLVAVAARLRAQGVPFVWDVIGTGSLAKPLAKQVAEQGLEGAVVLRGPQPNDEVLAAMRDAQVFVFLGKQSSGQYGLPNVLLEAAASGLCIISRPLDTLAELIEPNESGLVAESVDDFAAAITTLLHAPERAVELGRAAQARVTRRHSHETHVERLHAELMTIAEGRAPARAAA